MPVAESHVLGDGQQQEKMDGAGEQALEPPLPEPGPTDAEQTGNRPPAQPARLFEPLQPLREVPREVELEGPADHPLCSHGLALPVVQAEADGQRRLERSDWRQDVRPQQDVDAVAICSMYQRIRGEFSTAQRYFISSHGVSEVSLSTMNALS